MLRLRLQEYEAFFYHLPPFLMTGALNPITTTNAVMKISFIMRSPILERTPIRVFHHRLPRPDKTRCPTRSSAVIPAARLIHRANFASGRVGVGDEDVKALLRHQPAGVRNEERSGVRVAPVSTGTAIQRLNEMRMLFAADGLGGFGASGSTETDRSCQMVAEIQPELKISRTHRVEPLIVKNDCFRSLVFDFSHPCVFQ